MLVSDSGHVGPATETAGNVPERQVRLAPAASVTWTIHREAVLVLGWGRAILLQLASPLVARAVADHSGFHAERWGRLRRFHGTLTAMLTLTFGTPEEAAAVARRINAIHDRVHGRLEHAAGRLVAQTAYSAHDPALLGWVHATLVDSFLLTYELYVGPLTAEEKDRYCAEAAELESLLALPPGTFPRSVRDLNSYLERALAGGDIAVTDTARALAREVAAPPVPWLLRPFFWLALLPTVGLLPPAIRAAYGFTWDARRERLLRGSAMAVRVVLAALPSCLRHWPSARRAARRAGVPPLRRTARAGYHADGVGIDARTIRGGGDDGGDEAR